MGWKPEVGRWEFPQSREERLGVPGLSSGHLMVGVRPSRGMPFFWVRLWQGGLRRAASLVAGGGAIIVRAEVSWKRILCCG